MDIDNDSATGMLRLWRGKTLLGMFPDMETLCLFVPDAPWSAETGEEIAWFDHELGLLHVEW